MESSPKFTALLLISMLFISSATPILGCHSCRKHKKPKHKSPINLPLPPIINPPPPPADKCPIDTVKLGACVDLLGGLVHIGLGDPLVNECCPVLQGLVALEAAVCLCTTLKLKVLNLSIYVPLALQLLLTCGKAPPPGFTCTI